jgi:hypothetical protein
MLVLGDIVEAQYNGLYNEYYKAKIVNIREGSIIDVEYMDGEKDLNLEPHHLRKFVPYSVGEQVQVKVHSDGDFLDARIIKVLSDDDDDDDQIIARLEESQQKVKVSQGWVRRFQKFVVGDVVGVLSDEDDDMTMATVVKENTDGTVNIEFEDGDKMLHVDLLSLREWQD